MDKIKVSENNPLFGKIADLLNEARKSIVKNVNQTIVITYFEVGKLIVEEEQQGKERAEYGKSVLKELSQKLTDEFGKGYSVYNLERMRNFYLVFKSRINETEKSASLMRKSESPFHLSWTHYLLLIKNRNAAENLSYLIVNSSLNRVVSNSNDGNNRSRT
ncbi:MAG: DUF1016 N-terminal domain-containing protein [Draconibacterium sp.]